MRKIFGVLILTAGLGFSGCPNMRDQPRVDPYEESGFFADGSSMRQPVSGTIPRGHLREDEHLEAGKVSGRYAASFPFPVTEEVLRAGRERYNIYCAVCHNATGQGDGIIVRRGFKQPPSFHEERLRNLPEGYFFDVITNGFGAMSRYSPELSAEQRWSVIAYIRALQRSRHATMADVPGPEQARLESPKAGTT